MSELPTDYDGHIMRTPDEWCRIKQIQILDADGWRGRDGKDWGEPLTEHDFEGRAQVCTQRSIAGEHHAAAPPISDDVIEQAAKAACEFVYPPKTHRAWDDVDDYEQDSWRATARTLLEAAYPAIRQQVAEEIAAAADGIAEGCSDAARIQRDLGIEKGGSANPRGLSHMRTAIAFTNQAAGAWAVAEAAREIVGAE